MKSPNTLKGKKKCKCPTYAGIKAHSIACVFGKKKTVKKKAWRRHLPDVYKGVSPDADSLFDLICARNWFHGSAHGKMPVEENRAAFRALKELLAIEI